MCWNRANYAHAAHVWKVLFSMDNEYIHNDEFNIVKFTFRTNLSTVGVCGQDWYHANNKRKKNIALIVLTLSLLCRVYSMYVNHCCSGWVYLIWNFGCHCYNHMILICLIYAAFYCLLFVLYYIFLSISKVAN